MWVFFFFFSLEIGLLYFHCVLVYYVCVQLYDEVVTEPRWSRSPNWRDSIRSPLHDNKVFGFVLLVG